MQMLKQTTLSILVVCGLALLPVRAAESANPFTPPDFPLPTFKAASYNVKDFGAAGNGLTNDTPAINRAIEKCSAGGGGDVVFPAGRYSAASLHLKSNVRFLLDTCSSRTACAAATRIERSACGWPARGCRP
jgi:hypothetical protein